MSRKLIDRRVSVTLHLSPSEAGMLEAAAARAGLTRHDLVRARVLGGVIEDRPMLASLAQVIALRHRLDTIGDCDPDLCAGIVSALQDLMALARAESAR
ncbi:hypothetical protein HZF05_07200 [Sphingomonas sp. CGMCC 1.13654]|uniref:Uncharacterized protein n=1 Tax=Sphingomonas chungangi TaxID=2683589 RepID=A0A838L5B7_9SPHN|nr:hypothetical protein [Sphingomonas chungangi]MBA2933885.1 hypothetical protein [Sphingomonas chungangi]MVW55214.1 hypothetical protein [Sphingomonas chungangi]